MVISSVFYTYLCLIFVHIFFKSIRKMSTALKKTHCYRSLMKLCQRPQLLSEYNNLIRVVFKTCFIIIQLQTIFILSITMVVQGQIQENRKEGVQMHEKRAL